MGKYQSEHDSALSDLSQYEGAVVGSEQFDRDQFDPAQFANTGAVGHFQVEQAGALSDLLTLPSFSTDHDDALVAVAAATGFSAEHDNALALVTESVGFQSEHDSALADVAASTGFSAEHDSALLDLRDAGV